jgi:hypothetical protein
MTRTFLRFATLTLAIVCGFTSLHAQSPLASLRPAAQINRVAPNADLGPQTQLTGHIPGWVSNGVAASQTVNLNANLELTIVLQRDPAVQAAFTQFLADQQTPGNPLYHQWLTPQQVGTLFGPTASDLAAVTSWLSAQGLTIDAVQPNQIMINVHGTAAAVGSAFHTSFGYFPFNGEARLSAVNEPFVPAALAPVVNVVFGLTDSPVYPTSIRSAPHQSDVAAGASKTGTTPVPQYNSSSGTHYMSPGDFAGVYDSLSVLAGGNKGAGTNAHVAVIGRSRVAATDISEFASNLGIGSGYTLNTVIPGNGVDPGPVCTYANAATCTTGGDQGEQTLDVDRVVGNAPNATVDLIVATNLTTALQWNVSTVKDPIMTISYGGCEVNSPTGATTYDAIYSTGAAEGITTYVSSGDSGVNGCAIAFMPNTTTYTASMNWLCSSTYVTCVGGTEFIDTPAATYWATANTTNSLGMTISALSYIPEGAWNEPAPATTAYETAGTGGGPSLYISRASWQTGTGVPTGTFRLTPDVAYPAAQHDSYYACLDYQLGDYAGQGTPPITSASNCTAAGGGYFFGFAGTSAAAPAMAGVTALLNTKLGAAQGNLNSSFYTLAATTSNGVFHPITVATSAVGTCSVTVPSVCNNSTPGSSALSTAAAGGQQGYIVGTVQGYNEATGLGSIDVAKWLTALTPTTVSTTLAIVATTNPISVGQSDTFTATLTRSSTTPGAATGTVQFYNNGVAFGSAVTISNSVAVSASTTFSGTGTFSITAVYSGDSNYTTSTTTTAVSLVVNSAPSFSVTPGTTTYSLVAGATSGNTDVITLASLNSFVGAVAMTCTVTNVSGTAAGTCSATTPVTLASGGTGTSTLTINTTTATSGVLNVTVTGTNGSTVVTSTGIAVTVLAPSFTVTPTTSTYSLVSGATTGNTDVITFASTNTFAGAVVTSCTVANSSGTAAGTCVATTPVTLISGGTGTSTLTISTTPGTSGVLSVTVKGTSGSTVVTSSAIAVTLTASSFTGTATAISIAAGSTSGAGTATLTSVNGFAGTVTFACAIATYPSAPGVNAGTATCTASPAILTAGGTATSNVAVTTTLGTSGNITLNITGTGTTIGATIATTATVGESVTVTPPSFAESAPAALTISTSGATTGNTTATTLTSTSFAGAVSFTCSLTATSGSPTSPATCAASSVNLTLGGTATSTITVTSTTTHAKQTGPQQAGLSGWGIRGGAMLAMLVCLVPFRRRRFIRSLAAFVLLACGLVAISGCSSGGGAAAAKTTSDGTYTGTVTGTGTSTGAAAAFSTSATFTVTISN